MPHRMLFHAVSARQNDIVGILGRMWEKHLGGVRLVGPAPCFVPSACREHRLTFGLPSLRRCSTPHHSFVWLCRNTTERSCRYASRDDGAPPLRQSGLVPHEHAGRGLLKSSLCFQRKHPALLSYEPFSENQSARTSSRVIGALQDGIAFFPVEQNTTYY